MTSSHVRAIVWRSRKKKVMTNVRISHFCCVATFMNRRISAPIWDPPTRHFSRRQVPRCSATDSAHVVFAESAHAWNAHHQVVTLPRSLNLFHWVCAPLPLSLCLLICLRMFVWEGECPLVSYVFIPIYSLFCCNCLPGNNIPPTLNLLRGKLKRTYYLPSLMVRGRVCLRCSALYVRLYP